MVTIATASGKEQEVTSACSFICLMAGSEPGGVNGFERTRLLSLSKK